jgi:carboxyl-terminal processing protease
VVEEELPEELKKKAEIQGTRGEADLRGHLRGENAGKKNGDEVEEESGSSAYVPQDKEKDTQLIYALDLLRGNKTVDTETKKKAEADSN